MAQLEGRGQGLRKAWSPDVPLSHPILGLGPQGHGQPCHAASLSI